MLEGLTNTLKISKGKGPHWSR